MVIRRLLSFRDRPTVKPSNGERLFFVCALLSVSFLPIQGGPPMSEPSHDSSPASPEPRPSRLLDQLRQAALAHFERPEPGRRFADWTRRFILFHGIHHPHELGFADVARFLDHLAQTE